MSRKNELLEERSIKRFKAYIKSNPGLVRDLIKHKNEPEVLQHKLAEASTEPEVTLFLTEKYPEFAENLADEIIDDYPYIEQEMAEEIIYKEKKKIKKPKKAYKKIKRFKQKTKTGKIYKRTYRRWTRRQEAFVKYTPGKPKELKEKFIKKFDFERSVSSIKTKKRRLSGR